MSNPPVLFGPNERPNAASPHKNPIRRFREELRLTRQQFAKLLGGVKADTLRMWEREGKGKRTRPKGETAVALVELARRNLYPLTMEDIYQNNDKSKKKKAKKKSSRKKP